ncbi:Mitochondrial carrier domain-containing protein [Cynara cardunculus var. scolymus]|uniref:Mitochondrial carrier domain-containing protein n=1 Tax=Cynara cardunculus var. scolymus TaxID=59895 RepID=A0A103XSG4_CYNCS|nr:Mitochondrial carrier domain-containing protein [Cynara cardunculus var. scolymus]
MNDFRKKLGVEGGGYRYYGICTAGGMFSAGATHLAVTPLDVLKVNMQVNPIKFHSIASGLNILWKEEGPSSLWRGWSTKLFGYGVQGGFKFGLYEFFKTCYSDVLTGERPSVVFFLSSASAQVFADMALCPFEAVKVRVQTQPNFAKGFFYKGLLPLWGRNLPFSMIMFSTFEHSVDLIYRKFVQKRKEECSRTQQLGVTCLAGYTAGAVGTVISNPADNIVSTLYNKKANTVLQAARSIGLVNLFTRSLSIRVALVGPVVTLQWFFYDTIKVFNGLPTSGGLSRGIEGAA